MRIYCPRCDSRQEAYECGYSIKCAKCELMGTLTMVWQEWEKPELKELPRGITAVPDTLEMDAESNRKLRVLMERNSTPAEMEKEW